MYEDKCPGTQLVAIPSVRYYNDFYKKRKLLLWTCISLHVTKENWQAFILD